MNSDLWPHVWVFRMWAWWVSALWPGIDPFNPNAALEIIEESM